MTWNPCPDPVPGDRPSTNAVETIVVPRAVDLGEMTVRRALPSTRRQMVGPFIFFDQMGPAAFLTGQGIDVRPHPHINLATVTYLFEGSILHRDSLGTEMSIEPGAVNWMRAGRGIVHSERTAPALRETGQRLFGLQTWVALPSAQEESEPAFVHHAADALPRTSDGKKTVRLIAGDAFGLRSPLETASPTLYAEIVLGPDAEICLDPPYEERALYTIAGTIQVAGQSFEPSQLIVVQPGSAPVVRAPRGAKVMVFGGEPMDGPRYIWWNFVSSRLERIEQAKEEWARGQFDTVPGDAEAFIPLPTDRGRPRRATGDAPRSRTA
ncbi:MAG: pirin family protein [Myxococcota bacterium]